MNIMSIQAVTSQTKADLKTADGEGKGDFSAVLNAESDAAHVKDRSPSRVNSDSADQAAIKASDAAADNGTLESSDTEKSDAENSSTESDDGRVPLVAMAPASPIESGNTLPPDSEIDSDGELGEHKAAANRSAAPLFADTNRSASTLLSSSTSHLAGEASDDDNASDIKQSAKGAGDTAASAKTESEHNAAALADEKQTGASTQQNHKGEAKLAEPTTAEKVKAVKGGSNFEVKTDKASVASESTPKKDDSKRAVASDQEVVDSEKSSQVDREKRVTKADQGSLPTERAAPTGAKQDDTKTAGARLSNASSLDEEAAENEEVSSLMQTRRTPSSAPLSAAQSESSKVEKTSMDTKNATNTDSDDESDSGDASRKPADKAAVDKAVDSQVRTTTASQAPNWLAQIQHGERWANKADKASATTTVSAQEELPLTDKSGLAQAVEGAVKNAKVEQSTGWSAVNSTMSDAADSDTTAANQSMNAQSETQDASLMSLIRDSQQALTNDRPAPVEQRSINLQQGAEQSAKQLAQQAQVVVSQNLQEADIQLNPSQLGNLKIQVRMEQGEVQIQFVAQNPQARELLEQALPRLREMLTQQGMQLAQGQTGQQGQQSPQGGQQQQSQQHMLNQQQSGLSATMQQGGGQGGASQQDQQAATQHTSQYASANGAAAEDGETDVDTYLELADSVRSPSRLRSDARIDFFA